MSRVVVGVLSRKRGEETEYLLVKARKDFGEFTGYWYPPGGHIEDGESEAEALVREIKEELNLDILPKERIAETPGDIAGQTTFWWRCELIGEAMQLSDEIIEAGFFSKQEMKDLPLWPATKSFFEGYQHEAE